MADTMPEGIHLQKSEKKFFENAVELTKAQANELADKLEDSFKDPAIYREIQKTFQKSMEEQINALKREHEAARRDRESWDKSWHTDADEQKEIKRENQELEQLRKKLMADSLKSVEAAKENIAQINKSLDKSLSSYNDIKDRMIADIKDLKRGDTPDRQIKAYLKRYEKINEEVTHGVESALEEAKSELDELIKSGVLDNKTKFELTKRLIDLEASIKGNKEKEEIFKDLNDQVKNIFIESKKSTIAELEQLKIEKDREKREHKGRTKAGLVAGLLTPFRGFLDPMFRLMKGKDTEELLADKFLEKEKARQKEENKAIDQRDRITELMESAIEKLSDLGDQDGIKELLDNFNIANLRNKAMDENDHKYMVREALKIKATELMPQDLTKKENEEAKELADRANKIRAISSLFGSFQDNVANALEEKHIKNDIAKHKRYIADNSLMDKTPHSLLANEPSQTEISPSELLSDESADNSLMDKTSPNEPILLAKGGVIGAGFVFLARQMGLANGKGKGKNKDDEQNGKNILNFLKKNGVGLAKVAVPLLAVAAGSAMMIAGAKMQKRDSDDAKKYFDEGNTARGIETAILGDRARLTEENANRELGRTAGKTGLMAGGAGLAVAGGVGTAAMIGSVASAGGIAAAGGLGAIGTAGIAAMGAVLPPALIAAAVITAGVVVAKGTQEAFELGWDKNQAEIQRELSSIMLSEDSTTMEKIKAGAASAWKGFTGTLAGGVREAGKVLDAESMIQNEKQLNFIKEQAEAGSEGHQRLFEMMQSEQFKAMSEAEQKAAMQAEGLYDEFKEAQEATKKSLGEHLLTAGRTVGGVFSGMIDTTMEGMRGRETAVWEQAALKGMENMTGDDVKRLSSSADYQEAMSNGKDHKGAMQAAYLAEERKKAIARGDLGKDGMAIQNGNWLAGMTAGAAAGSAVGGPVGTLVGGLGGALGGAFLGKYMGLGDTGLAYQKRKTGTDELDDEYRQTFEYSKKKAELMGQGMTAEEADLEVIKEQNALYEEALTLRLKQSKDYKDAFDAQIALGASIEDAERIALESATANTENMMTTSELVKNKLKKTVKSVKKFFTAEGQADFQKGLADAAKGVWNSVSEWFSGLTDKLKDGIKSVLGKVSEGWNWVKDKAGAARDWLSDVFSDDSPSSSARSTESINDGIVTKDGKVIQLSPDDNVYATKNEFKSIRDQEAQAAMPNVPRTPAEFTDNRIVEAIQILTDVLRKKEIAPVVMPTGDSVNFDQFRMAEVLV